ARNLGASLASGDYLLFLDSDDEMLPGGLATLAAFLDSHSEIDVVFGDGYYCDGDGAPIEPIASGRTPIDIDRLLDVLALDNVIRAPFLVMLRRRSLARLPPPLFDESLHGTEDADLWIRLAAAGFVFREIDEKVGKYRLHQGNDTSPSSATFGRFL